MDEHHASLTIGAFARRVGLTPSALRFYDDWPGTGRRRTPGGPLRSRARRLPRARLCTDRVRRRRDPVGRQRPVPAGDARPATGFPAWGPGPVAGARRRTGKTGSLGGPSRGGRDRDRGGGARARAGAESVPLSSFDGEFPAYRDILTGLGTIPHRIIVDRDALRCALADSVRQVVRREADAVTLPAICLGSPSVIAFDPAVLGPAVEAGVGPDVLLGVTGPVEPVVVRSADQGSFTTLLMPMKLDDHGHRDASAHP